jgi:hypothetical protein
MALRGRGNEASAAASPNGDGPWVLLQVSLWLVLLVLLPDRETTSIVQWLQAQPGVVILVRDRPEGCVVGAPDVWPRVAGSTGPTLPPGGMSTHMLGLHSTKTLVLYVRIRRIWVITPRTPGVGGGSGVLTRAGIEKRNLYNLRYPAYLPIILPQVVWELSRTLSKMTGHAASPNC